MGQSIVKRFALILFVASCWAVQFTTTEINISRGQPFTLQWEGAKGPVEIRLLRGDSSNLDTVQVITSGNTGNTFTWTPPDLLLGGDYVFSISDGVDQNYSSQWYYEPTFSATTTGGRPQSTATTFTTTRAGMTTFTMRTQSTTISTGSPEVTTPPGSASRSSTSPESNPTASSSANESRGPATGELSTGAKAGIGVGAGLVGLGLLGALGFLIFRRGKAAGQQAANTNNIDNQDFKAELGGESRPPAELGGQVIVNMHSGHTEWREVSELDATPHPHPGAGIKL